MGCIVMRQSGENALITEEPDERIVHVRFCGGTGRVTADSTRMQEGYRSMGKGECKFEGARKRAGSKRYFRQLQNCIERGQRPGIYL